MKINLSENIYSYEAILKAIYFYKNDFNIEIKKDGNSFIIFIESIKDIDFDKKSFMNILLEQQLRETLNNQYGLLRNKIYVKAFSLVE